MSCHPVGLCIMFTTLSNLRCIIKELDDSACFPYILRTCIRPMIHFCFADTGLHRMHVVAEKPGVAGGTAKAGSPRCAHDLHKDTLHTLDTVFSTFADLPAFHEG